jgi:hypothetical protein
MQNSYQGTLIRKRFSEPTLPVEPFKRVLNVEERVKMYKHFSNHSWSNVDATGKIVLGGGEEAEGLYYINEEDLSQLQ